MALYFAGSNGQWSNLNTWLTAYTTTVKMVTAVILSENGAYSALPVATASGGDPYITPTFTVAPSGISTAGILDSSLSAFSAIRVNVNSLGIYHLSSINPTIVITPFFSNEQYLAASGYPEMGFIDFIVEAAKPAGVLPGPNDDVYANDRTVYVDINTKVLSVRNRHLSATSFTINSGGGFIINSGISLSANIEGGGRLGNHNACVRFLSSFPHSGSLNGNLSSNTFHHNGTLFSPAFNLSGSGSFLIVGDGIGAVNHPTLCAVDVSSGYINVFGTSVLTFSGNVIGALSGRNFWGIYHRSTGNFFLTGNIYGGTMINTHGIVLEGGRKNVFIRGDIYGQLQHNRGLNLQGNNFIYYNTSAGLYINRFNNVYVYAGIVSGGQGSLSPGIWVVRYGNLILSATNGVYGGPPSYPVLINSDGSNYNIPNPGLYNEGNSIVYGNVYTHNINNWWSPGIYNQAFGSVTIYGDLSARNNTWALWQAAGLCEANIIGNVFGGNTNNTGGGVYNGGSGSVTITGNVIGGSSSSTTGIRNDGFLGIITVNGNISGGNGASSYGVWNNGAGSVIINGDSIGGNGDSAHGCQNDNVGSIIVKRAISNGFGFNRPLNIAGRAYGAVGNNRLGAVFVEQIMSGALGLFPTAGIINILPLSSSYVTLYTVLSSSLFIKPDTHLKTDPTWGPSYSTFLKGVTGWYTYLTTLSSELATVLPRLSDVRLGEKYNFLTRTGTLIVPNVFTVNELISTDNTLGKAAYDATFVWSVPFSASKDVINSVGYRIDKGLYGTNEDNDFNRRLGGDILKELI